MRCAAGILGEQAYVRDILAGFTEILPSLTHEADIYDPSVGSGLNVEDLPPDARFYEGDLAKKGGKIHVYLWDGWVSLAEANQRTYQVQA